jgi:hypothetical protein
MGLAISFGVSIPAALLLRYYLHLTAVIRFLALWLRNPQDTALLDPRIVQVIGQEVLDNQRRIEQGMLYRIVEWAATPTLVVLRLLRHFRKGDC